jgi:hypothetical protein
MLHPDARPHQGDVRDAGAFVWPARGFARARRSTEDRAAWPLEVKTIGVCDCRGTFDPSAISPACIRNHNVLLLTGPVIV